jgi:quercetin dioxygenase-like cupin family protein
MHIEDLAQRIEIPTDGTLSVTLHQDEHVKIVLFAFGDGQELSEHTASVPAIMQLITGQARWRLGEKEVAAKPNSWVYMPAHLPHAVRADSPCIMLLTMIRAARSR